MRVVLDPGEIAAARVLATLRQTINRASAIRDQRRDKVKSGADIDYVGMLAEIAWAKKFNSYPDLSISPRAGSADAIFNGKRIDIKATDRKNGRLLATTGKAAGVADIYVLAIVDDMAVDFVGYALAGELINHKTIKNLGHGNTYALEQSQLRKFKEDMKEAGDTIAS